MKLTENFAIAFLVIVLLWIIHFFRIFYGPEMIGFGGLYPQELHGLKGILFAPFLHGDVGHIVGNSGALFVLLIISLSYNRRLTVLAVIVTMLAGGFLVWLIEQPGTPHIGASGVIFGLIGFLLFTGIFQNDMRAAGVAMLVLVFYGGALLTGFKPRMGVSWTGHLFGFLTGILAAWLGGWATSDR